LQKFLQLLRRHTRTDRPVVVEWWHKIPWYADCALQPDHYLIRLSPYLSGSLLRDVLAHEWAHAMAWGKERVLHGQPMFRAYSWTYRILVDGWRPRGKLSIGRGRLADRLI
jgi:hypothetical protein